MLEEDVVAEMAELTGLFILCKLISLGCHSIINIT